MSTIQEGDPSEEEHVALWSLASHHRGQYARLYDKETEYSVLLRTFCCKTWSESQEEQQANHIVKLECT